MSIFFLATNSSLPAGLTITASCLSLIVLISAFYAHSLMTICGGCFLLFFLFGLWLYLCNVFDVLLGNICKGAFTIIYDVQTFLPRLKNSERRLSFTGRESREHIFLGTI